MWSARRCAGDRDVRSAAGCRWFHAAVAALRGRRRGSGPLLRQTREDVQPDSYSLADFGRIRSVLFVGEAREKLTMQIEPTGGSKLDARPDVQVGKPRLLRAPVTCT